MQKIIKFRAWDKNRKVMFVPQALAINENSEIYYPVSIPENIILLQFTGLLDKHGKEIYEGDFVFGIREGVELVKFYQEYNMIGYNIEWEKSEIIGNIYQNPHLLEGK